MRKRSLLLAKSDLRNLSYNTAIKHHHQVAFEKLLSDYDFYLGSSHLYPSPFKVRVLIPEDCP